MEVASTSLRPSRTGATAARCSGKGSEPCSGLTTTPGGRRPPRARAASRISRSPGRKASALPGSCAIASAAASATPRARSGGGASAQRVSTGWARPWEVTTGASSISAATGPASSVADITSTRRSGRSAPRASQASASARSASSERSWNSSSTRCETPSSEGSAWMRRVSTPSVTTSIRVAAETRASPRIRRPTVRPTGSPSVSAMRAAAARTARRRGSSITTRAAPSARSASGTRVVLPAPGGAWRTARP